MGLPMHGNRRLFIWRFDETKDLTSSLVKLVAQVSDAVLLLRLNVGGMGLGNRIRC